VAWTSSLDAGRSCSRYFLHWATSEPKELLATMAGYFALTGQIVG
jgi:hypothetical protein